MFKSSPNRGIAMLLAACLLPGLVHAYASFGGPGFSAVMLTGVDDGDALPAGR